MGTNNNYDIRRHRKGDTFEALTFNYVVNGSPSDLTGAAILMDLRVTPQTAPALTLSVGSGITITDDTGGVFNIDKQIIDIAPAEYLYDIEITFASGDVKTWVSGNWTIFQDISRP